MRIYQTYLITLILILFTAGTFVAQNNSSGYFYGGLELRNEITRKNPNLTSVVDYPFYLELSEYKNQTPGIMLGYLGRFKWLVYKAHVSYWAGTKSARYYSAYITSSPFYEPEPPRPYNTGDHYYQVWEGFEGKLILHNIDLETSIGVRLNKMISLNLGIRRTNEISYSFTGLYYETFTHYQHNGQGQLPTMVTTNSIIYSHKKIKKAIPRKPEAVNYLSFGMITNCKFVKRDGFIQLDYNAPVFKKKFLDGAFVNLKVGISLCRQAEPIVNSN